MLFIVKYWQLILAGVLAAALAASGVYITVLKGQKETLIAEKEALVVALDVANGSITRLQTAIGEQNTAINKLKTDADVRERANQVEVAKAKAKAEDYRKQAADIMGKKVPQGANVCDAANMLFNEEIKKNGK